MLDTHRRSCSQHATFDAGIAKKDQQKKNSKAIRRAASVSVNCGKRKIECWTLEKSKVFVHLLQVTYKMKYIHSAENRLLDFETREKMALFQAHLYHRKKQETFIYATVSSHFSRFTALNWALTLWKAVTHVSKKSPRNNKIGKMNSKGQHFFKNKNYFMLSVHVDGFIF